MLPPHGHHPNSDATTAALPVLKALNDRQSGAHTEEAIQSLYLRNYDFTLDEVKEALALMETGGLVKKINKSAPSFGHAWQITLEGSRSYATR